MPNILRFYFNQLEKNSFYKIYIFNKLDLIDKLFLSSLSINKNTQ